MATTTAGYAVELQTFGGEALDTDVVGYAMVLEVPIPDVMEQRAEVEGQVSLIDFRRSSSRSTLSSRWARAKRFVLQSTAGRKARERLVRACDRQSP